MAWKLDRDSILGLNLNVITAFQCCMLIMWMFFYVDDNNNPNLHLIFSVPFSV